MQEHAIKGPLLVFLLAPLHGGESLFGKAVHSRSVFSNFRVPGNHPEGLQKQVSGLNLELLVQEI